jgi:hypothetical protein
MNTTTWEELHDLAVEVQDRHPALARDLFIQSEALMPDPEAALAELETAGTF